MPTGQDILNQLNQSPYKEAPPTTQPLQPANMNALLAALGQGLMKPVDAAQNIMGQGDRSPSNMTIDPGQEAFNAGPMAVSRVFGMAPANSASITASKLMQRTDMPKIVKELRDSGLPQREITKSVNNRFASELDYGQSVRQEQIKSLLDKIKIGEDKVKAEFNAGRPGYTYNTTTTPTNNARIDQLTKAIGVWESALQNTPLHQRNEIRNRIEQMKYQLSKLK